MSVSGSTASRTCTSATPACSPEACRSTHSSPSCRSRATPRRASPEAPMLVVVSDIHLSDGSTANNVHGSAFELLSSEILAAKEAKGATELHLLLLGDIFDL